MGIGKVSCQKLLTRLPETASKLSQDYLRQLSSFDISSILK